MAGNKAAWLDGPNTELRVAPAEFPKPRSDEVVVKNFAVAVNQVDWKIQDIGLFVKEWPVIVGSDIAGEVYEVGPDVKNFKKGDRVVAHVPSLATGDPRNGGFQLYSVASAKTTAILPDSITYAAGSVLPLAIDTALIGLISSGGNGLGLPTPSLNPKPSGKTIVVWGGSSSVGTLTRQLAIAAGAKVIATASSHNFDFVKKSGATEVIDYKKSTVVDDVVQAVKSAGGDFVGVYDAISLPDQSYKYVLRILEKLGGGILSVVLPPPESVTSNVQPAQILAVNHELTAPVWHSYITPALAAGKLKALPEPLVVGKGLESIQKGLHTSKAGVSAQKVVVEL